MCRSPCRPLPASKPTRSRATLSCPSRRSATILSSASSVPVLAVACLLPPAGCPLAWCDGALTADGDNQEARPEPVVLRRQREKVAETVRSCRWCMFYWVLCMFVRALAVGMHTGKGTWFPRRGLDWSAGPWLRRLTGVRFYSQDTRFCICIPRVPLFPISSSTTLREKKKKKKNKNKKRRRRRTWVASCCTTTTHHCERQCRRRHASSIDRNQDRRLFAPSNPEYD